MVGSIEKFLRWSGIFILCLGINACTTVPDSPYQEAWAASLLANPPQEKAVPPLGTSSPLIVEFDDTGAVNVVQRRALLETIDRQAAADTLLIFVHGWHNNAKPGNENLKGFTSFLQEMNCKKPPEDPSAKCESSNQYTGVYIGWRGDSQNLLGIEHGIADFLTFWDRQSTSVKVGEKGLKSLLEDLDARVASKKIHRYAVIGHSLGGSVVLHAVKDRLKHDDVIDDNLYVLINPAVAATEYLPYRLLKNKGRIPKLVTLQAKNDYAVRYGFRVATLTAPMGDTSTNKSHDLNACDPRATGCADTLAKRWKEANVKDSCFTMLQGHNWVITTRNDNGKGRETCEESNHLLGWVVWAKDGSVEAHNGILTSAQARALHGLLEINRKRDEAYVAAPAIKRDGE
ncbi:MULTISPECIES: alpha/beta hydrolase [Pseudomonas putida group]|uniref:Alpha/beta hydrolase n=2 Tax=Pseudomonas TaxID=286 RepID=A0A7V8J172_PSEPU|nr:alpha/beta hydrolase [Pseudomonas putida]KAF0251373.1 alpha/beta hydrolase [Pseudomonas putida]WQE54857.1 alpha/beta hydrolase [Pseudomonas putida]HDS1007238.1 alpha/beta hydrolase [Pseudomonas putida]